MGFNKNIAFGIICIIVAIFMFFSDGLNGIVRPITYIFLLGSSKGKDIMFFALIGLFLFSSQLYKINFINNFLKKNNYYLKIAIILSFILAIGGILLEIIMRNSLSIDLNTIFVVMRPDITTTSILHSHIYKSIAGGILSIIMGSIIPLEIHTGSSLFIYVPQIAILLAVLFPIIITLIMLSLQKRNFVITVLLSFFGTCTVIGILDGGFFATPVFIGLCGMILIFRNEYFITLYLNKIGLNNKIISKPDYIKYKKSIRYYLNRFLPYLIIGIILILRFSITFIGSNPEYYEVNIKNPDVDISNQFKTLPTHKSNETTIFISSEYNEMELLNAISEKLEGKSDYMTMTWNGYSYL